jgi:hypothetical protein
MSLFEKLQELVEAEVQKQLMKYAQIISKKHDISLKLLLRDIPSKIVTETATEQVTTGQCLGITAAKRQCKVSGKHGGYCMRHVDQKKVMKQVVSTDELVTLNPHVGHIMKECMYLIGCPACEKSRGSKQNLLIDI